MPRRAIAARLDERPDLRGDCLVDGFEDRQSGIESVGVSLRPRFAEPRTLGEGGVTHLGVALVDAVFGLGVGVEKAVDFENLRNEPPTLTAEAAVVGGAGRLVAVGFDCRATGDVEDGTASAPESVRSRIVAGATRRLREPDGGVDEDSVCRPAVVMPHVQDRRFGRNRHAVAVEGDDDPTAARPVDPECGHERGRAASDISRRIGRR